MVNKRATLLSLMIGWDFSLHLVETFGWVYKHPLYPWFPLWNISQLSYTNFWTVFWGVGFLLALSLVFKKREKALYD